MWPSLSSGHTMITFSGRLKAAGSRRYRVSISLYIVKWKIGGCLSFGTSAFVISTWSWMTSRNVSAFRSSVVLGKDERPIFSAAHANGPDCVDVSVLQHAAAPVRQHAFAVREPVPLRLDAALGRQLEANQAKWIRQQCVVMMRGIEQPPVAGELLHLETAVHAD